MFCLAWWFTNVHCGAEIPRSSGTPLRYASPLLTPITCLRPAAAGQVDKIRCNFEHYHNAIVSWGSE